MANKITIQHLYTTGSSAPNATALTYGEIAMATKTGDEAIFFKNQSDEIVSFISSGKTLSLITEKTSGITSDENFIAHKNSLAKEFVLKPGTSQFNKDDAGHVLLVGGDLIYNTGETVVDGIAASPYHFHSQYLTGVTGDSGQPIVSLIENGVAKIGLTTGITNQINSGVSGYTRIESHEPKLGATGETGHVKLVGGDLSGNTGNTINGEAAASHHIHGQYIAKDDISNGLEMWSKATGAKEMLRVKAAPNGGITVNANGVSINTELINNWNKAKRDIDAFFNNNAAISGAVDTLKEINEYLTGTGTSVETLLKTLDDLTDTVDNNTTAITQNRGNISDINDKIGTGFTSDNTITSEINKLKGQQGDYVTSIVGSGNINASKGQIGNKYTITHTSAGTQTSAITAANTATTLSFGSGFTIVNKIGYDANGHVVSGTTQTLKLPDLENAQEIKTTNQGTAGIVGIVGSSEIFDVDNLTSFPKQEFPVAAGIRHYHSQYIKLTDLSNNTGNTITISCGTY